MRILCDGVVRLPRAALFDFALACTLLGGGSIIAPLLCVGGICARHVRKNEAAAL